MRDSVVIGVAPASPRLREIAGELAVTLRESGVQVRLTDGVAPTGGITLRSGGTGTDESYRMVIDNSGIAIDAPTDLGALWGVQTLRQLIGTQSGTITLFGTTIHDAPRYAWRGSMLDVGRHLLPVGHILTHLEWMSRHKLNVFHWHLTDDQGWRIQVDALPRLTEIGGWRTEDGVRYGGFYSTADIRRVVERARQLGITVVPEIEMPGHSRAAIAAYPDLGCTGDTLPVPTTWGVFADVLCPGKESTFTFIETVLGEVLELFPSRYIHIGGDEVPKNRWRACASCQEIIRREHLGDERGLQRWMIARVGRWLAARDRKLIGWDEIMDGGVPAGATVQAWQGGDRITAAIAAGADVVASPQEWVYLNRQASELPLDRVAAFDPSSFVGQGTGRLLGGEAPLWTEHVTSAVNAELMWWPRLAAFAQAMWSGPVSGEELERLLTVHVPGLHAAGLAIGPTDQALATVGFQHDSARGVMRVTHVSGLPDIELRIHSAGNSARLPAADVVLPSAGTFRVVSYFRGEPIGEGRTITMQRHAAVGRTIRLATPTDPRYPGTGPHTLVDGARGTTFNDGLWNGWWGPDLDAVIDLEQPGPVTEVSMSLLEQVNSWIVYPDTIELHHSLDDTTWQLVQRKVLNRPVVADAASRELFSFDLPADFRTRYVRVIAKGGRRLPAGHSAAGQPAWIFADEIVVRSMMAEGASRD